MDEQDESDLQIQRASRWALPRLIAGIALFGSPEEQYLGEFTAHKITNLQLDPSLRDMLPPLVERYLDLIQDPSFKQTSSQASKSSTEIAKIISQFCKVRGAKVISRFLNNEPRYIEPMLTAYSLVCPAETVAPGHVPKNPTDNFDLVSQTDGTWQESYTMLLWLGHLMLAPFDLATISTEHGQTFGINIPFELDDAASIPSIALRVIQIALPAMRAANKRQSVAAALLVRLVTRPDMQKLGLLDASIKWALARLSISRTDPSMEIHEFVGLLSFLSGMVVAADITVTNKYLRRIFDKVTSTFQGETLISQALISSATAKRIAIKIQRNIVLQVLVAQSSTTIDPMAILEDVIDFLLNVLGDRDTQVRKAASKALSVITGKVDPNMGEEIVEAVLGSLGEDVLVSDGYRSLQAVNPLKWHGLTLTLAQMLFRRSPSPTQLPAILNALFSALAFEQRSAAGSSVGGNVRDAANFGLWSLARRYTTDELNAVKTKETSDHRSLADGESILQITACHLLSAACLDPVGNVRRGSSAALQELIGRHPDKIYEGISLVQTVDYHAVGLRRRATTSVVLASAKLHKIYQQMLEHELLTWRGIGSIEKTARQHAAEGLGKLSELLTSTEVEGLCEQLLTSLEKSPRNEVELRHGLIFALSSISRQLRENLSPDTIILLWSKLENNLAVGKENFASISLRPELTAGAMISLIANLSACTVVAYKRKNKNIDSKAILSARNVLGLCLLHVAEADYGVVVEAVRGLATLSDTQEVYQLIQGWVERPRTAYRSPALMVALGAVWQSIDATDDDIRQSILDNLVRIAGPSQDIEARVVAMRSIGLTVDPSIEGSFPTKVQCESIVEIIEASLNDYTINERGDIGSLLRGEALATFSHTASAWKSHGISRAGACMWAAHRLALEKLHKVRAQAVQCLTEIDHTFSLPGVSQATGITIMDVSTYEYFRTFARRLALHPFLGEAEYLTKPAVGIVLPDTWDSSMTLAILEGFSSTAGVGPDDILQLSREALLDVLDSVVSGDHKPTLRRITDTIISLLRTNLSIERNIIPILELLSYLLDAGILQRMASALLDPDFKWRTLLSLVQKAHFKSTSIQKLVVAVDVYRGLAQVPQIRVDVLNKLTGMLMHPFPTVRLAVAETLWIVTGDEVLKPLNFSKTQGKGFVESLKGRLCS
ncbi:hypothetical protein FH972_022314 [Carpinus fangiana]|uniref:Uncharacterized protein n=1 Tax=Carpinus fangiana TaxID=176857 RepID=A0A5N6KRW7_9ROSI|nr:hypothetical protein FH972_022314 [Carpinus fangiana]